MTFEFTNLRLNFDNNNLPNDDLNLTEELSLNEHLEYKWEPQYTIIGELDCKWIDEMKDLFTCCVCGSVKKSFNLCGRCIGCLCSICEASILSTTGRVLCPKCRNPLGDLYFSRHDCDLLKRLISIIQTKCDHCLKVISLNEMVTDHRIACPARPIKCPFATCEHIIQQVNLRYDNLLQHVESDHGYCIILPFIEYESKFSFVLNFPDFIGSIQSISDIFAIAHMANGHVILFSYKYIESENIHIVSCRTLSNIQIRIWCVIKWAPYQYFCDYVHVSQNTETALAMTNRDATGNYITFEAQLIQIS